MNTLVTVGFIAGTLAVAVILAAVAENYGTPCFRVYRRTFEANPDPMIRNHNIEVALWAAEAKHNCRRVTVRRHEYHTGEAVHRTVEIRGAQPRRWCRRWFR